MKKIHEKTPKPKKLKLSEYLWVYHKIQWVNLVKTSKINQAACSDPESTILKTGKANIPMLYAVDWERIIKDQGYTPGSLIE